MQENHAPSFYGAVTLGERGQVVIPQAAREAMGLKPGDKLLVASGPMGNQGLMMVKAEAISEMMTRFTARIGQLEQMLKASEQHDKET